MNLSRYICLSCVVLALQGCSGTAVIVAAEAVGITQTRPDDPPPADTEDQIAEHESWCYESLGYAECYTKPQKTDANRLINVDPQNRYPLTPQAYRNVALEANP